MIESHVLVREALHALINEEPDLKVAAQALDCSDVLDMVIRVEDGQAILGFRPDVIVLGDGSNRAQFVSKIQRLKEALPEIPILALAYGRDSHEKEYLQAGAQSVLARSVPGDELIQGIRRLVSQQKAGMKTSVHFVEMPALKHS